MEIQLGKAQLITAKDDSGVSMFFRCDPSSSQLSRCPVLSVEVLPRLLPTLLSCRSFNSFSLPLLCPIDLALLHAFPLLNPSDSCRRNERNIRKKTMNKPLAAMPLKSLQKCSDKCVTPNSMKK